MSEAQEQVPEPRKVNKLEQKRAEIRQQRRQRLLNDGVKPEDVEAVMAKADWEALSVEKRVEVLRQSFLEFQSQVVQAIRGISDDARSMHSNQKDLADAMDVNFGAFAAMLDTLGVTPEQQKTAVQLAEETIQQQRAAVAEAAAQAKVEAAIDQPTPVDAPPPESPEGATEFNG